MPGGKYASIQNVRQYRALRRKGHSKQSAARITNAQNPPGINRRRRGRKKK